MTAAPPPPPSAEAIFGSQLGLAVEYAELLAGTAVERGLIGPREGARVWERHLLNCAVVSELVPPDSDVTDIGSGAGLPGLPLAIARPDLRVTLVEPLLRRSSWLVEAVEGLSLTDRVSVLRCRAADLESGSADVVTSRAVAPLSVLLPMSARVARRATGVVLALKGRSATDELTEVHSRLPSWSLAESHVALCGDALLEEPTTVVWARRAAS